MPAGKWLRSFLRHGLRRKQHTQNEDPSHRQFTITPPRSRSCLLRSLYYQTDDSREGASAFREKRRPEFRKFVK